MINTNKISPEDPQWPSYNFVEYLAASEGDDFWNIEDDNLSWCADWVNKYSRGDRQIMDECIEYEYRSFELYCEDKKQWMKKEWDVENIHDFKRNF